MILVRFADGSFRKIPATLLGRLIRCKEISHFRRSSGWVDVTRDALRKHYSPAYQGRERRDRPQQEFCR